MQWTPHPYQLEAAKFALARDSAGLLLPPGMGKTSITMAVLTALFQAKKIKGVLLIAPIRPLELTWPAERVKWGEFGDLYLISLRGGPGQRNDALNTTTKDMFPMFPVWMINPELTDWLCDWMAKNPKSIPFDMIVIDESTKFKNPGSKRFKALKLQLRHFKRRMILTGTPSPNGLLDLWAQVYILDNGLRLGRYISHYHRDYFVDVAPTYADYSEWAPAPGAQEIVERKIKDVCMSLNALDHLKMPKLTINDVPVKLSASGRKVYDAMEKNYVAAMDGGTVSAGQASSVRVKLRQITGGGVYDDAGQATRMDDSKLEVLSGLIEELSGDPVIVAVGFLHEVTAIRKHLGVHCPYLGGGVKKAEADKIVTDWNDGKIPVLLAHPTSVAHGLNLQSGGATVCWYTLTDNREEYDQLNARVYRQGQKRPVVIHRLIADNTVDADIVLSLAAKDKMQSSLLTALKMRIGNETSSKAATQRKRKKD